MKAGGTALILIGFQNDYFASDGVLHRFIEESSRVAGTLDNTLALLDALKRTDVALISTPIVFTPDYSELIEPVGILEQIRAHGAFREGTWGCEAISPLRALGSRIQEVPGKRGLDAFTMTNLDGVLREAGVTHVVFAGAVTSICIDSTARSAAERGYRVTVLEDCTSSRTAFEQRFYCREIFPLYASVMTSEAFLRQLREGLVYVQ